MMKIIKQFFKNNAIMISCFKQNAQEDLQFNVHRNVHRQNFLLTKIVFFLFDDEKV